MSQEQSPDLTPLGVAIKRWFPLIAIAVALTFATASLLLSRSIGESAVVFVAMLAVFLFGFYVPPIRRDKRGPWQRQ